MILDSMTLGVNADLSIGIAAHTDPNLYSGREYAGIAFHT
jgi:hypothetical protein